MDVSLCKSEAVSQNSLAVHEAFAVHSGQSATGKMTGAASASVTLYRSVVWQSLYVYMGFC